MAPQHSGYGEVSRLAHRRLKNKFNEGDLTLRDKELEPIQEAVKILGGRCLHAKWLHDDPNLNQWYTFASHLLPKRRAVLALLHVPAGVMDRPSGDEYRQVQELLHFLLYRITRRILVFSYEGDIASSAFRSRFRELESIHKNALVEFKPWRDVEAFSKALDDSRNPHIPSPPSKRSMIYEARKLLSLR